MLSEKYLEGQAKCGLKVGDTVIVERCADFGEGGWEVFPCNNLLKPYLGKELKVSEIDKHMGVLVIHEDGFMLYVPYFNVKKIAPKSKTENSAIQVTYLNDSTFYVECPRGKFILEKIVLNGVLYARCIGHGWECKMKVMFEENWGETGLCCLPSFAIGFFDKVELVGPVG